MNLEKWEKNKRNTEPRPLGSGLGKRNEPQSPLPHGRGSVSETEPRLSGSDQVVSDTEPRPSGSGQLNEFLDDTQDFTDVLAYFITYTTYGTWLHGDARGSVDRKHNVPGTQVLPLDAPRNQAAKRLIKQDPVELDGEQRAIVQRTIQEVAKHRGWTLHAINVRTNHVHVVVTANVKPEKIMNDFKSWSTRRMVEAGTFEKGRKVWVRHGSTHYLWDAKSVDDACLYVAGGQGIDL